MEKYIAIIKDDIKRFIKNYLIAGKLVDMRGMSDLEEYIPSKFPYLSVLYLLNQNGLNKEATWFIDSYNSQLLEETDEFKKIIGYFLESDMDKMENKIKSLTTAVDELTKQKEVLTNNNRSLENENEMLRKKVEEFTKQVISPHNYEDYIRFTQQYYKARNSNKEIPFSKDIRITKGNEQYIDFIFRFDCLNYGNACFNVCLKRDGILVGAIKKLDITKMSKGKTYQIVFPIDIPAYTTISKIELYVDDDPIITLSLIGIDKRTSYLL